MIDSLETRCVRIWHRLLFRWRRDSLDRELEEELSFHLHQKQAEQSGRGVSARYAIDVSRQQLGNVTLAREECRDMCGFISVERFFQDVRFAFRAYRRTPVFTVIAVLSLALGIGGNAAMFTLVQTLLVRPLPYSQPERLVRITGVYPRAGLRFFEEQSRAMDIAAVSSGLEFHLSGLGQATRHVGSSASTNFLSVFGIPVARGRSFNPGEDFRGRDGVVIISHTLWKDRFGSDPSVLGRVIRLNGINREIVGIMPAGFSYPSTRIELWVPMRLDPSNFLEYWGTEFMPMVGRLRGGATLGQAQDEIRNLVPQFRGTFPYPMARDWNADSIAIPLQQDVIGDVRGKLIILLSAVGLVLLIACANVASLLLSRATTRRKELALRVALGAGRLRIVLQLLTECVGLALTGAVLGLLFATSGLSIFKSVLPPSLPGLAEATIDWQIVAAVAALALLTGLASGIVPALSASQIDVTETIKTGSHRATSGFWSRMRGAIIVGEVALTLVLLVGAGLLLRSLFKLSQVDVGFDPARILAVQISPNQDACKERAACTAFYDRLLERTTSAAGVASAAIANSVPLDGQFPTLPVDVEGHPRTLDHPSPMLWLDAVSPGYLRIMHIPLLAGRHLSPSDGPRSPGVVLISAQTAKHFWPTESAIGKHIKPTGSADWRTVVGVVGDVRHYSLNKGLPAWVAGTMYMPYSQAVAGDGQIPAAMTLLAKVESNDAQVKSGIQQLAEDQDPNVPVGRVQRLEDVVSGSIADFRSTMQVFISFAAVALALAAIGIYGLMSYWVSQRTYEIGLRVALGATKQQVVSLILTQGIQVSVYGVIGGIIASVLLTRFLAALLYNVATTDVLTFAMVTALVLGVAAVATAFPAWRATRIDPVKSLRAD